MKQNLMVTNEAVDRGSRFWSLRLVHVFLLSLNISLAVGIASAQTSFSTLEMKLQFEVNVLFRAHPHSNIGGYTAFLALCVGLAFGISAVLWLFSGTVLVKELLRSISGILSLLALPMCWLYIAQLFPVPPGLPDPSRLALLMELAVVMTFALLYLRRTWRIPDWASVTLLTLHFILWGWLLIGGVFVWREPIELVFLLVGFCSCIVWGIYTRRNSTARTVSAGV